MSGRSVSVYTDTSASHEYLCALIKKPSGIFSSRARRLFCISNWICGREISFFTSDLSAFDKDSTVIAFVNEHDRLWVLHYDGRCPDNRQLTHLPCNRNVKIISLFHSSQNQPARRGTPERPSTNCSILVVVGSFSPHYYLLFTRLFTLLFGVLFHVQC